MLKIKFKIFKKKWKVRLLSKSEYKQRHGRNCIAITDSHKRKIDLSPYGLTYETIAHELVHAYLSEICITSTDDVTNSDMEEIFADLMGKYGDELLSLANYLMDEIKGLKNV